MYMQRQSEFRGAIIDLIDEHADRKQDAAIRDNAIRIFNIDMASRHVMAQSDLKPGWFCLSVKDRCEFSVLERLEKCDVEAHVPRRVGERKVHRGRMLPAPLLPVIPGYLLVKCIPSAAAFVGLRAVKGVTGIVSNGGYPYRVPERFIIPFMDLANEGKYDFRPEEHGFEVHMDVRVCDGPFSSFMAVVTDISRAATEGRINVEVSIFGRSTPVEMDLAQIEKV